MVAETLAGAAILGGEVFDYNRENFRSDREQRFTKEFKEMNFRIEQGGLWRQDLRDICDLVQKKCKTYLLVAVITLGFSMSLWCQGRLPIGTPSYIMLGNQVAAGGGFGFLTMVVWLAMYASVAAQSYTTRLLTQLVRLPIPTWHELEACRTYSSSFEKLEGRQLFRIPFLMGPQEGLVSPEQAGARGSTDGPMDGTSAGGPVHGSSAGGDAGPAIATDPWGLEARGDKTYELGAQYGQDVSQLRHIKLMRHAALYWQSYDAFARISLNIGVSQIILGLSYFILGYVCVSLGARVAAIAGVLGLIALTQAIAKLDISIAMWQQVCMHVCLIMGPAFACMASWTVSTVKTDTREMLARFYMTGAFFFHGMLLLILAYSTNVKLTQAGDYLPTSFNSVLYLDAFGFVHRTKNTGAAAVASSTPAPQGAATTNAMAAPVATASSSGEELVGYYAMDYMEPGGDSFSAFTDAEGGEESTMRKRRQPGVHSFEYDVNTGQPHPSRYQDAALPGTEQDMRQVDGAPTRWDLLDAQTVGTRFFSPASFFPCREDDDDIGDIQTGHDSEKPGYLPWKIFRNATVLLGVVWLAGAVYQLLDAISFAEDMARLHRKHSPPTLLDNSHGVYKSTSSFLQTLQAGLTGVHPHAVPEKITFSSPMPSSQPMGMSCDRLGHNFILTDGLALYAATKVGGDGPLKSIDFHEIDGCTSLLGEAFDDTAIICNRGNKTSCALLVLHRNGRRVAACPLHETTAVPAGQVAAIPQQWLQGHSEAEQVGWISAQSSCEPDPDPSSSQLACISVGTTQGRVAHLLQSGDKLVPEMVLPEEKGNGVHHMHHNAHSRRPGVLRSFSDKFVGVLQPERNIIRVLDATRDLMDVGSLSLPTGVRTGAFCVGGGYVYLLSEGPKTEMWRMPLPESLSA